MHWEVLYEYELIKHKDMSTLLLIVSAILFIATFGIHIMINMGNPLDRPAYTTDCIMSSIPLISGFILPVIPLAIVSGFHWLAVFFINLFVSLILGPMLTRAFLVRFASGKGLGKDMMYSFIIGVVTLVIGLIFK